MGDKIIIAIGSALIPAALGGIGMVIAMRIQVEALKKEVEKLSDLPTDLAILKEKVEYQAGRIRDLLTKIFPTGN